MRSDGVAAALVLGVLLNLSFFPYLWGGKTLLSGASDTSSVYASGAAPIDPGGAPAGRGINAYKVLDPGAAAWQTEPDFAQIAHQLFVEKHAPLWNPTVGYGEPLAAGMLAQPYFPLSLIVVAHPSSSTYNWWCIARLFVAGLGAFCFLRLFTSFWPALTAGISMMYAGYFLLYYDIAHVSVETLVPWLFYVNERLVRAPRYPQILGAAVVNVLVYLGGMPESQLLALACAYLYAVYRVLSDRGLRVNLLRVGGALAAEAAAGAGGAAFLLLPFLEYMQLCFDIHQASNTGAARFGLRHDENPLFALTYTVPLIFGPPFESVATNVRGFTGVRGFCGIGAAVLALVAVFGAAVDRLRRADLGTGIVPFFAAAVLFFVLKRFGVGLVNWVGLIPGFSLIDFPKYEEPLLAFAIAVLAGLGVARIAGRSPVRPLLWCAGTVALAWLAFTYGVVRTLIAPTAAGSGYPFASLVLAGVILTLVVSLSLLHGAARLPGLRAAALIALVGVLALESSADYLLPMHYIVNVPPPSTLDPYRGAPFVRFLQQATSETHERIVGQNSLLYPDWAGAFGLDDVRDLDAMYDRRYLPFARALINANGSAAELAGRFTSMPQLQTPNQLRFLALSSVRYVATADALDAPKAFFGQAYFQNIALLPAAKKMSLVQRRYRIGGVERAGLLEHPPFDRLPLHVTIPPGARRFTFGVGMDPAVYAPRIAMCGAGATFALELRAGTGRIAKLAQRSIDPKHDPTQRRWIDQTVDVSRWAGQTVDLLLSTAPWPGANTCADWAVWGDGTFAPLPLTHAPRSPFELAFRDGDVRVYRFAGAGPRVGVYANVKIASTPEAALTILTDPAFDATRSTVITPRDPAEAASLAELDGSPAPVVAGKLLAYDSQDVRAHVSASRRSVVVLNDTDFPGWHAYVDGTRAPVLLADSLFRGVVVDAGEHDIEFKYEPDSFRVGSAITLATILVGIGGAILWVRRRRATAAAATVSLGGCRHLR